MGVAIRIKGLTGINNGLPKYFATRHGFVKKVVSDVQHLKFLEFYDNGNLDEAFPSFPDSSGLSNDASLGFSSVAPTRRTYGADIASQLILHSTVLYSLRGHYFTAYRAKQGAAEEQYPVLMETSDVMPNHGGGPFPFVNWHNTTSNHKRIGLADQGGQEAPSAGVYIPFVEGPADICNIIHFFWDGPAGIVGIENMVRRLTNTDADFTTGNAVRVASEETIWVGAMNWSGGVTTAVKGEKGFEALYDVALTEEEIAFNMATGAKLMTERGVTVFGYTP